MERQSIPARRDVLTLPGPLRAVASIGALPDDDEVTRLVKELFAIGHLLIGVPALRMIRRLERRHDDHGDGAAACG